MLGNRYQQSPAPHDGFLSLRENDLVFFDMLKHIDNSDDVKMIPIGHGSGIELNELCPLAWLRREFSPSRNNSVPMISVIGN